MFSFSDLSYIVSNTTTFFTTRTYVITLAPPDLPLPLELMAMRTL